MKSQTLTLIIIVFLAAFLAGCASEDIPAEDVAAEEAGV